MGKRAALIIESSNRVAKAPAYQFYRGKNSRWVNHIMDYMEVREFQKEHIYFLSFYEQRIIPYESIIKEYPKTKAPTKTEQKKFARKIIGFIKDNYEKDTFVEIHTGKNISSELATLLKDNGYAYMIYAENEMLASKHKPYIELIEQEKAIRKIKDMKREKIQFSSILEYRTAREAEEIIELLSPKAAAYGIEDMIQELNYLLKKRYQRMRDERNAFAEFESFITSKIDKEVLSTLERIESISELTKKLDWYETIKTKYGKLIAKFTRYLAKKVYVQQTENRINESLFRLQLALLK